MENQSIFHNITKFDKRDEELAKIEIGVQGAVLFLALFGNSLVLMALRLRKQKTSRMHLFIMHLSIADILVAFFNILPQMAWDITFRFKSGELVCRVVKYMQVMVMYLSTYILVMTAIDRYLAICRPLSNYAWTPRKAHVMVGIAWIMSLILSLPQLFLFTMREVIVGSGIYDCYMREELLWIASHYVTFFTCAVYFLPFLALLFAYGNICWQVWVKAKQRDNFSEGEIVYKFNGSGTISMRSTRTRSIEWDTEHCSEKLTNVKSRSKRGLSQAKLKTVKLTFVVIIAYVICWSPFFITQLWRAYDSNAPQSHGVFVICILLGSLNSCCNPWIYIAFSGSLMKKLLPCYTRGQPTSRRRNPDRCRPYFQPRQHRRRSSLIGMQVHEENCGYHGLYENNKQNTLDSPDIPLPKHSSHSKSRQPPERKQRALDSFQENEMDSKRNSDLISVQKIVKHTNNHFIETRPTAKDRSSSSFENDHDAGSPNNTFPLMNLPNMERIEAYCTSI